MKKILKIALPDAPIKPYFDYLLPEHLKANPLPGVRIIVPFGRQKKIGFLIEINHQSEIPAHKLKPIISIIDEKPIFKPSFMRLILWASQYYHYPLGEVIKNSLPKKIKSGEKIEQKYYIYQYVEKKNKSQLSKNQKALLAYLEKHPKGLDEAALQAIGFQKRTLSTLEQKGNLVKIEKKQKLKEPTLGNNPSPLTLNTEQKAALNAIQENKGFQTFLLDGITGSGKTEVYLQAIKPLIQEKKQVLILVPEINLTPQTIQRFQKRFPHKMAVFHSKCSEQEKLENWKEIYNGKALIIIGTRSALFAPLKKPGMIILDEEHDLSFKQQSSFRYSARDLAIVRGKIENIPVILGSATPSLESFQNVALKKFRHLQLNKRSNLKPLPRFYLINIKDKKLNAGISPILLEKIESHLKNNNQVLIFLNRRGFSPILLCHSCGWVAYCQNCDAKMVWHHNPKRLFCHYCGFNQKKPNECPSCQDLTLLSLGSGTERLEAVLSKHFSGFPVIRVDKDSTRLKGSMENILEKIKTGKGQILVGTQMLAKGHHFPNLTMVAILEGDSALYSANFKAGELMGQLITQVAGRAGREDKLGEVYIQTHQPNHPWLETLVQKGYRAFAQQLMKEREIIGFPPFTYLAAIRAEARELNKALGFLNQVRQDLSQFNLNGIKISTAIPAWMEKKANAYRAILLIRSKKRALLHQCLKKFTEKNYKNSQQLRWFLEVDPIEIL
jgi:primosomal protein N' (replication factor Y) (superfamily II helicase)